MVKKTARVYRERGRPTGKKQLKVINKPFTYGLCEFCNNNVINLFGCRSFLCLFLANCLSDCPKKSYSNELFVHAYGTTVRKYVHNRRNFFFNEFHRRLLAITSSSGCLEVFGKSIFEVKKNQIVF